MALVADDGASFASFTWSPLYGSSFFSSVSYVAGVRVVAAGAITFAITLTFLHSFMFTSSILRLKSPACALVILNFEPLAQTPCAREGDFMFDDSFFAHYHPEPAIGLPHHLVSLCRGSTRDPQPCMHAAFRYNVTQSAPSL